jgi:hypothetical protein
MLVPMVGDRLKILLWRTVNKAPEGGATLGHSLCVRAACVSLTVESFSYADYVCTTDSGSLYPSFRTYLQHFDGISPDTSVWLFFGWMTLPVPPPLTSSSVNSQETSPWQVSISSVVPPVDLSDVLEELLEIDEWYHRSLFDHHRVISTCTTQVFLYDIPDISFIWKSFSSFPFFTRHTLPPAVSRYSTSSTLSRHSMSHFFSLMPTLIWLNDMMDSDLRQN